MHNLTFIYLTGALLAFYSVLFLTFKSLYKKRLAGEGVKILKALGFYFLALILPLIIGYGRYQKTFNFTVLEVFFDEIIFPHMLLQTRGKGIFWSRRHGKRGKNERSVALESELNDYYNLFFHDGYGVEATQIFSEDFLRFLKDENSYFDIELNRDRLYIYDSTAVKRKREFEELFRVAGRVINRIVPVLNRLENDFAVLNKYYLQSD